MKRMPRAGRVCACAEGALTGGGRAAGRVQRRDKKIAELEASAGGKGAAAGAAGSDKENVPNVAP